MSLIVAYFGIVTILIIALNARYFGEILGIMDDPATEAHKQHAIPTPLVGALMVGTLATFIVVNQLVFDASTRMVGVSVCTILVGILGLVDDKFNLNWQFRLFAIGSIATLLVLWVPELRLDNLAWSFGYTTELSPLIGSIFTILCLMTLVISFNMMDGFNGGVISMCLILFVIMALVATNPHRQAICLFLISALGIMFVYNMKGEFFLGDGGAYALGMLTGSVALLTYNVDASITIYADTIFLWLAFPALDCLRVVIERTRSNANPFHARRDHLHHILIKISGPKRTLLFFTVNMTFFAGLSLFAETYTYLLLFMQIIIMAIILKLVRDRLAKSKVKSAIS